MIDLNDLNMYQIEQNFDKSKIEDIEEVITQELKKIALKERIKPGMCIGITVGSRGIKNITQIIKAVIKEVIESGGKPFLIPAMGSHGNASVKGHREILESYGFSEESMGVPIEDTMEVVEIGRSENGLPVYFNKKAFEAEGLIIVNRVKVHTVFKAKIESGLHKMLAVGLGNHKGASFVHSLGPGNIPKYVQEFGQLILKKAPVLCGVGILENAYDETRKIVATLPEDFLKVDQELLQECKALMPALPVKEIDVLILQEMGKDISGAGIDTNIVGGVKAYQKGEYDPPVIDKMVILDLTAASHGNAIGMSIGDIITKRLFDKIDFAATYKNVITCGYLDRAKTPVVLKTDKEAIEVALKTVFRHPGTEPRVVLMRNTLHADSLLVSEAIYKEIKEKEEISCREEGLRLTFDREGNLTTRLD